ncbi:MAG: UMP kinase [Candidatus Diapherotrites archaeon]|nr:UMP kinase [Candidatus Diapherotrites archaeon]
MKPCVIKIGGSVLVPDSPDVDYMRRITSVLRDLNKSMVLGVVVGGGNVNSRYVHAAREMGVNQYKQDWLGIDVTRLNARLLMDSLGWSGRGVPASVDDASELIAMARPFAMGGTVPGHTTNAVAAMLAENTGARLVNCTNVDGIYDKDPSKHSGAKKLAKIGADDLVAMAAREDSRSARGHFIIDLLAAKIIARSGIEAHVVNGADVREIKKAALGKKHNGTVIV